MINNLVAKHSRKLNKPKVFKDKKKDYQRKEKYSYSNSYQEYNYKHPDI